MAQHTVVMQIAFTFVCKVTDIMEPNCNETNIIFIIWFITVGMWIKH